jgi:hypothetical protein
MLEKNIKATLLEIKEKKESILIEQNLVKNRIMMIVESEDNIKNFKKLPKSKQTKIARKLVAEIGFLHESNILNEQDGLMGFLKGIFGNSLSGILQTIVEPMVNSLLSGLGLTGYFKDFLVSFITTNPLELAKALKSCEAMTSLVAQALSEGLAMMIMREQGLEGSGYTFLRNALGGAVKDTKFIESIESQVSGIVCQLYDSMTGKASDVVDKLKPETAAAAT